METGSLLVPMVLASQIAFIERWPDKNLKVSGTIKLYNIILKQCTYLSLDFRSPEVNTSDCVQSNVQLIKFSYYSSVKQILFAGLSTDEYVHSLSDVIFKQRETTGFFILLLSGNNINWSHNKCSLCWYVLSGQ